MSTSESNLQQLQAQESATAALVAQLATEIQTASTNIAALEKNLATLTAGMDADSDLAPVLAQATANFNALKSSLGTLQTADATVTPPAGTGTTPPAAGQ